MPFDKELLEKLEAMHTDQEIEMEEIVSGTTTVDLTASNVDLSDQIEAIDQMIAEMTAEEE